MPTTYGGILSESAFAVANHGFAEEEYVPPNTRPGADWHALVTVSATVLLNLGETDLAERFRDKVPGIAGALIWIKTTADGTVQVVEWGTDEGPTSGTDKVSRAWDEFTS